jgi:eukaryotic-like serine/threonine-protein kinase
VSSEIDIHDPKLGTRVADRYRLDERLAAGGMGVVYRGVDLQRDRPVAVKFVHEAFASLPTLVKRFQREVAAMQRLSHKNLVAIVDSGVAAGVPYLVMDYHEGQSLNDLLDRGGGEWTPRRALTITRQILAGVGHAHESGVVHRDLKPDNMLVLAGDEVKILDFGLAKMISEEGAGTQLTNTGFALGTPGYMSPEQARGGATDERTDVYAVGVILYQGVTGRRPFVAESPMAVLRMHMDEPPLPPRRAAPDRKISRALESVILRALEKDPARRWQSAAEMARALDATPEARGEPVPDEPEPALTVEGRRPSLPVQRSSRRPWLLALVLLCAGGAALAWARLSQRKQDQLEKTLQTAVKRTVDGPVKQALEGAGGLIRDAWHDVTQPPPSPSKTASERDDDEDEGSDNQAEAPKDTPGAQLEASAKTSAPPAGRAATVDEGARLLAAGNVDAAISVLYRARRTSARSPGIALLLGHAYFRKLWRSDGLREYDAALQLRPAYKRDKLLVRNVVSALDDPTSRLARSVLKRRIGTAALSELVHAAKSGKNSTVQKRAGRLVSELRHHR